MLHHSVTFGHPRLNEPAPEFRATTTHGVRALEDYAGKWLVLFSHPADFTPVCTSEFVAFAEAHECFQSIGCELLGLSVDSVYSHIAWLRNIEEKFGVAVHFPIIADASMEVARAYGMIHPSESDTASVRSVFVIDPDGFVRAILQYPMTTGRSVSEILRLVQALSASAEHGVATPEGWKHGEKGLAKAPATVEEADRRTVGAKDVVDWYFERKRIPLE
ncbi:MAG: peroxiredoxin [Planctomycetota bacterium]